MDYIYTQVLLGYILWSLVFWTIAHMNNYQHSLEFTSVFRGRGSKFRKFVMLLLWPAILPVCYPIVLIINLFAGTL